MPRVRNPENKGFPNRWRLTHGAIYYQVPKGMEKFWDGKKSFRLGKTLADAYTEWAKRFGNTQNVVTVGDLLQRYFQEVSSKKPPQSLKSDRRSYNELTKAFHDVRLEDITPQDIYKYIDKRTAKIAARREKSMLSHAYTKAVEWGYITKHPFKGEVRLKGEKARTRYIEDWEIAEIMQMTPHRKGDIVDVIKAYINFKILSGLRQGDILRLKVGHASQDGIFITAGKTGKTGVMEWTPALREAWEKCLEVRPFDIAPNLFCNRRGKSYMSENTGTASGWQSVWQRFMERVLTETKVKERFTEHDLRAKAGSDSATKERAQELLMHDSVATTIRAYRRKPVRIRPLK